MKKIQIIILALLCNSYAIAQIKIKTDQVEITLPKATVKVNKPQTIPRDDGTVDMVMGGEYEYEGQFLDFTLKEIIKNPNFLNEIKSGIENRRRRSNPTDEYYQNKIEQTNKDHRLISRNKAPGYNYYLFYITNKDYTYNVSGMLSFLPGEELKAKLHLDEILKGIRFKD